MSTARGKCSPVHSSYVRPIIATDSPKLRWQTILLVECGEDIGMEQVEMPVALKHMNRDIFVWAKQSWFLRDQFDLTAGCSMFRNLSKIFDEVASVVSVQNEPVHKCAVERKLRSLRKLGTEFERLNRKKNQVFVFHGISPCLTLPYPLPFIDATPIYGIFYLSEMSAPAGIFYRKAQIYNLIKVRTTK
jgi:hypothetical protein